MSFNSELLLAIQSFDLQHIENIIDNAFDKINSSVEASRDEVEIVRLLEEKSNLLYFAIHEATLLSGEESTTGGTPQQIASLTQGQKTDQGMQSNNNNNKYSINNNSNTIISNSINNNELNNTTFDGSDHQQHHQTSDNNSTTTAAGKEAETLNSLFLSNNTASTTTARSSTAKYGLLDTTPSTALGTLSSSHRVIDEDEEGLSKTSTDDDNEDNQSLPATSPCTTPPQQLSPKGASSSFNTNSNNNITATTANNDNNKNNSNSNSPSLPAGLLVLKFLMKKLQATPPHDEDESIIEPLIKLLLHCSCSKGYFHTAHYLLTNFRQQIGHLAEEFVGETPLHRAAFNGHLDCVKVLLAFGMHLNAINIEDRHAVEDARTNSKNEVVEFLENDNDFCRRVSRKFCREVLNCSDEDYEYQLDQENFGLSSDDSYGQVTTTSGSGTASSDQQQQSVTMLNHDKLVEMK